MPQSDGRPPSQLSLFDPPADAPSPTIETAPVIHASTLLPEARSAFHALLEAAGHSKNTVSSYAYDLSRLEQIIGPKRLDRISNADIAKFLGDASSKLTRKRRITSVRRFFAWIVQDLKAIAVDPTEGFAPQAIPNRPPAVLSRDEQTRLLDAAKHDEPWSASAIWLMLRLGLSRAEILGLERDHIDRTRPERPMIEVIYADPAKRVKERTLDANAEFSSLYDSYLEQRDLQGRLFPVGPPAINGMVERVRFAAGIEHDVTPHTLRHTFGVESARAGADVESLLAQLGLANEPRNRTAVGHYVTLANRAEESSEP